MKRVLLILVISIFALFMIVKIQEYYAAKSFKDVTLPNFIQNKQTNELLYVDSPTTLIKKLLATKEKFTGKINLRYLNHEFNKAEITFQNSYTEDDSIEDIEYLIVAEQRQQGWTIVEYKAHWKCRENFINNWTTEPCS